MYIANSTVPKSIVTWYSYSIFCFPMILELSIGRVDKNQYTAVMNLISIVAFNFPRLYDNGFRMDPRDTEKLVLHILTGPPPGWYNIPKN